MEGLAQAGPSFLGKHLPEVAQGFATLEGGPNPRTSTNQHSHRHANTGHDLSGKCISLLARHERPYRFHLAHEPLGVNPHRTAPNRPPGISPKKIQRCGHHVSLEDGGCMDI